MEEIRSAKIRREKFCNIDFDFFSTLPQDVFCSILLLCDPNTLVKCIRISTHWRNMIKNHPRMIQMWLSLHKEHYPDAHILRHYFPTPINQMIKQVQMDSVVSLRSINLREHTIITYLLRSRNF